MGIFLEKCRDWCVWSVSLVTVMVVLLLALLNSWFIIVISWFSLRIASWESLNVIWCYKAMYDLSYIIQSFINLFNKLEDWYYSPLSAVANDLCAVLKDDFCKLPIPHPQLKYYNLIFCGFWGKFVNSIHPEVLFINCWRVIHKTMDCWFLDGIFYRFLFLRCNTWFC